MKRVSVMLILMHLLWFFPLLLFPSSCIKRQGPGTAKEFLEKANQDLKKQSYINHVSGWIQANFITKDTTFLSSHHQAIYTEKAVQYAMESPKYKGQSLDEKRMLQLLLYKVTVPSPPEPQKNESLALAKAELEAMYGSGKFCKTPSHCKDLVELSKIISSSRSPKKLMEAWEGWRTISPPMKEKFEKVVQIGNQGAKNLGFAHLTDFWQSSYSMSSSEFNQTVEGLFNTIQPLYKQLHCYVRWKLHKKYGSSVVDPKGPIPAHLLGNMWAQSWENISDLLGGHSSKDEMLTKNLKKLKYTPRKMMEAGESFFVSLGMPSLPQTFYKRSLFAKPLDRNVVCHASAWHINSKSDVRIKMCVQVNSEDFNTILHELGHTYYQLAYQNQPFLYQDSAHKGFHEGLGDTIELSVVPSYLKKMGLLPPNYENNHIQELLGLALKKVAFLPFALMLDTWRWKVFSGEIQPKDFNAAWWELRKKYQGVVPPRPRLDSAFDPGAKYHVPAFVPYIRYFFSHILQFQFHRALCKTMGFQGDLHQCSIHGNKEVGKKMWAMMQTGMSRPWPETLKALTGSEKMDASALTEYFAPLEKWLIKQNKNSQCGW